MILKELIFIGNPLVALLVRCMLHIQFSRDTWREDCDLYASRRRGR